MAKANKAAKNSKRMVRVHSKRYGEHDRNPRGTFKPAVLNEAMVQSKNNLLQVNKTASLIFSAIRNEHRDGTLWTRLLSTFRNQLREQNYNDVHCLLHLEGHAEHTLRNMLRSYCDIKIAGIIRRQLHITMMLEKAPRWKTKNMFHFQASMHVIYPDLARKRIKKEVVYSDVFSLYDYPKKIPFAVPVPSGARAYAVFLKVTGCKDGVPQNGIQSTGIRCVVTGEIENPKSEIRSPKSEVESRKSEVGSPKLTN
jgi:hypothetical protein